MYSIYRRVHEKEQILKLLPYINIVSGKGFEECVREETAHLVT
jgi:hypothetical protein